MQYSHLTKYSEGAAREDQQSLTWTRTDTSQCEVTEAVGWMVEVVPWKRGKNMLRQEGDYLVVVAQKHREGFAH